MQDQAANYFQEPFNPFVRNMKLEITETAFPTEDSVTLRFRKTAALEMYKPGQHGVFLFNVNGKKYSRNYSFHTVAKIDPDVAITIRLIENGIVSKLAVRNEIDTVELESISGSFVLEPSPDGRRHLVMFAGGSGITPIMAMIRAVLHQEPHSTITLIYSNRTYARIIFRTELNGLESEFTNQLRVLHVLTDDADIPSDFPVFYRETLSRLIVRKLLKTIQTEVNYRTEYYLCGPLPFMLLIEDALGSLNVDKTRIYKEHFFIPETKDPGFDFSNLPPRNVTIIFINEQEQLVVDGGRSILQTALQNNIRLTHSCTEGQCGMCRAFLLNGEVKLRKNHVLTDDELKAGQILLCQGFPVSDNVSVRPIN